MTSSISSVRPLPVISNCFAVGDSQATAYGSLSALFPRDLEFRVAKMRVGPFFPLPPVGAGNQTTCLATLC